MSISITPQREFEHPLNRELNRIHFTTYRGGSLLLNKDKKENLAFSCVNGLAKALVALILGT